jgi:hypothetical protein
LTKSPRALPHAGADRHAVSDCEGYLPLLARVEKARALPAKPPPLVGRFALLVPPAPYRVRNGVILSVGCARDDRSPAFCLGTHDGFGEGLDAIRPRAIPGSGPPWRNSPEALRSKPGPKTSFNRISRLIATRPAAGRGRPIT